MSDSTTQAAATAPIAGTAAPLPRDRPDATELPVFAARGPARRRILLLAGRLTALIALLWLVGLLLGALGLGNLPGLPLPGVHRTEASPRVHAPAAAHFASPPAARPAAARAAGLRSAPAARRPASRTGTGGGSRSSATPLSQPTRSHPVSPGQATATAPSGSHRSAASPSTTHGSTRSSAQPRGSSSAAPGSRSQSQTAPGQTTAGTTSTPPAHGSGAGPRAAG